MVQNTTNLSDFFKNDYVDQASYDNLRKIASLIDGQKNAMRKVIHTMIEKNIKHDLKVSQLSSKIEEFTEYLHGDISGVLVNMGADYIGSNNLPLVQKGGNFGTRFENDNSAPRYIAACASSNLWDYFDKNDSVNLIPQTFEGNKIEPRFFVPTLPILLINGSMDAVSSGFAQQILPRNPIDIKKLVLNKLDGGKRRANLTPFFSGFNGSIIQGDNPKQWLIKGVIERKTLSRFEIKEIPVGREYELKKYIKVLDKLEDDKFITSYEDRSEDDNFHFIVKIPSKTLSALTDDQLLVKMKLIKTITENYTVINHANKIVVFDTVDEIVDEFLRVKNVFMNARKASLIIKYNHELNIDNAKYNFIRLVNNNDLIINKRKKEAIEKNLESLNFYKIDNKFNYLLSMSIHNLTVEKMAELKEQATVTKSKLKTLEATTPSQLLIDDIEQLK